MLKLHDKSCMLDSFCHVLEIDHLKAITYLGHDGSEHGFHSQELIDLADYCGRAVTEIQRHPLATHPETHETIPIEFAIGNDRRFMLNMQGERGVLMGRKLGRPHAMAWIVDTAIDPANGIAFRLISEGSLIEDIFQPLVFLRIQRYE